MSVIFNAVIILLVLSVSHSWASNTTRKVMIDTPTPCVTVDRVDGPAVYLRSKEGSCVQVTAKTQVELPADIVEISIYVDGALWKKQMVKAFDTDAIVAFNDKGKEAFKDYTPPTNNHVSEGEKKARELVQQFQSPVFQNKINQATEQLKATMFSQQFKDYYKDAPLHGKDMPGKLPFDQRIYVFVSSSVPLHTLRSYAQAIDKLKDPNIVMVMKGFVGGLKDVNSMLDFVSSIIVKTPGCETRKTKCDSYVANLQVDPLLFSKYQITRVPAVVYAQGVSIADATMSEGRNEHANPSSTYQILGDAPFNRSLDVIDRDAKSPALAGVIAALEKGFY